MYYQYPLEALARRKRAASQLDFARQARVALQDSDELLARPLESGLALFAANEDALEAPVRILRDIYGDFVELRSPRVRVIPGEPEAKMRADRTKNGVPLPDDTWAAIVNTARDVGVSEASIQRATA